MNNKIKSLIFILSSSIAFSGCDIIDDNDDNGTVTPSNVIGVVATVASDYSVGATSIISGDSNRTALNELQPSDSDITINTYKNSIYIIGRAFGGNNIAKFDVNNHNQVIWQYTTQDSTTDPVASNPHQIVFVNESKAYVLRYGKTTAWIVNPSAATQEAFKTGELDLSAYSDSDGIPEMTMGVVADGKLFIAMQRLSGYTPDNTAYIAVFDTTTDTEIDTGFTGDNVKGIPLTIRNPNTSMQYLSANNSIYIQGIGSYGTEFTGGIERINISSYQTSLILDDGTAATHPDEKISSMAIVSPTLGYYISYKAWGDTSLYKFDPSTGGDTITSISSLASGDQADVAVDANGLVWVSDTTNSTVRILDPTTDSLVDSISTILDPKKINFITQ